MAKNFLLTLLAVVVLSIIALLCWQQRCNHRPKRPLIIGDANEPALVIEVVLWLQEEVGCNLIDAKVGPETKRLVNAQCELDKPEYYNRQAAPYHTPSGAPKGDER